MAKLKSIKENTSSSEDDKRGVKKSTKSTKKSTRTLSMAQNLDPCYSSFRKKEQHSAQQSFNWEYASNEEDLSQVTSGPCFIRRMAYEIMDSEESRLKVTADAVQNAAQHLVNARRLWEEEYTKYAATHQMVLQYHPGEEGYVKQKKRVNLSEEKVDAMQVAFDMQSTELLKAKSAKDRADKEAEVLEGENGRLRVSVTELEDKIKRLEKEKTMLERNIVVVG